MKTTIKYTDKCGIPKMIEFATEEAARAYADILVIQKVHGTIERCCEFQEGWRNESFRTGMITSHEIIDFF